MERAFEEGEWRRVENKKRRPPNLRKKPIETHQNHLRQHDITTFFIGNIPDGVTSKSLWMKCKNLGTLADVFIPNKKDRSGNKFAFVRFKRAMNIEAMEKELANIKIDGAKLSANLARFDVQGNRIEKEATHQNIGPNCRINVQVSQPTRGYGSFKEVLTGTNSGLENPFEIKVKSDSKMMGYCSGKSLVGEVRSIDILNKLDKHMGLFEGNRLDIRYLGGFKVMLTCESESNVTELLENENSWNKIFTSLVMWNGQEISMERIAWVNIHGVPPQAWETDTFYQIGCTLGRITFLCDADSFDADMSKKQIGLTIKSGNRINQSCLVNWRGHKYKVYISETGEEWLPDFLKSAASLKASYDRMSPEYSMGGRRRDEEEEASSGNMKNQGNETSAWNNENLGNNNTIKTNVEHQCFTESRIFSENDGLMQSPIGKQNNGASMGQVPSSPFGEANHQSVSNISPSKGESDPFGLHELIFNCGKENPKKRKRIKKTPTKSLAKDRNKKVYGVMETDKVRVVKRMKVLNNSCRDVNSHLDGSLEQSVVDFNRLHNVPIGNMDSANISCESMDLNRMPKGNDNLDEINGTQSKNDDRRSTHTILEKEVKDTMEIGRCVGIELSGFEDNIRLIINGEGAQEG